jgi:hypothetical protein
LQPLKPCSLACGAGATPRLDMGLSFAVMFCIVAFIIVEDLLE